MSSPEGLQSPGASVGDSEAMNDILRMSRKLDIELGPIKDPFISEEERMRLVLEWAGVIEPLQEA